MALPISPYNHVFIDFEFVGDINNGAADCRIWGIGAIKSNGSSFMVVCQVPTNRKTHEGCVEITVKYLKEHAAVPFTEGFARFANWVGPQAVLISHNSFRSDKLVLEQECRRHNILMPCWYFFDSLLFLRTKLSLPSYKLADVYEHVTGKPFMETHTALADAIGLWHIMQVLPPEGMYMYPKYITPLQNIRGVGAASEYALIMSGIRSVEHLVMLYTHTVQVVGDIGMLATHFLRQFNLPVDDLTPIAKELAAWIPREYGGISTKGTSQALLRVV